MKRLADGMIWGNFRHFETCMIFKTVGFWGILIFFGILIFSLKSDAAFSQEITSGKPDGSVINVLLIDGQGTHNWRETTPILKKDLEETGLFDVTVETTPEEDENIETFHPDFSDFDVVLLNYCGKLWSSETRLNLLKFVADGGGLVLCHSANTAFPDWAEFNQLLVSSGWGNRGASFGPYLFWEEGRGAMALAAEGPTGTHGFSSEFQLLNCAPTHPIMLGIPAKMLHGPDEMYSNMRSLRVLKNFDLQSVVVLAAAYSTPEEQGSGRLEPQLIASGYGKGRVFQIFYGHSGVQCRSVAFIVPFLRGTQWAAAGVVTIPIPEDVPTEEKSYSRP